MFFMQLALMIFVCSAAVDSFGWYHGLAVTAALWLLVPYVPRSAQ